MAIPTAPGAGAIVGTALAPIFHRVIPNPIMNSSSAGASLVRILTTILHLSVLGILTTNPTLECSR